MSSLRQFLRLRRPDDAEPGSRQAGFGLRSSVLLHQLELDRQLAAGATPDTSPDLGLRSSQLLSPHVRQELAACVESVLARSEHPPHWHSTALPIQAAAVQAARPELELLRDALLEDACSCSRGVALASLLLHDEHSPVYTAGADDLAALARSAAAATNASGRASAG